jgi:hypothetical protein
MNYFKKGSQLQPLLPKPFGAVVKPVPVVLLLLIGLPEGSVTPVVTFILYVDLSGRVLAGLTSNVLLSLLELGLPLVIRTQVLVAKLSVDSET